MGDFSMFVNLPSMYKHCHDTEDKDMTPIDFVTDHLVNIDGVFDKHDNGDEQKPHTPVTGQHSGQSKICYVPVFHTYIFHYEFAAVNVKLNAENEFTSEYITKIFHPPSVS